MSIIFRRFIALFLSAFFIVAPTIHQANAASSWNITGAVAAGSRTVVSASKAGYKSAVNVAPTAGRLALRLGKGANWAALVYAAIQLAPELADIDSFKPQYDQNRVEYKVYGIKQYTRDYPANVGLHSTPEGACSAIAAILNQTFTGYDGLCRMRKADGTRDQWALKETTPPPKIEYIPIPSLASQVIKNANQGHAPSQAATREAATEMVIGGQFDADLLAGAVPTNDTKPLIPAVPISGNGNQGYGGVGVGDGADDGMSGATPGEQSDAAKDAADASKNSADAAKDAAKAAAEQAAKDAADAEDLINSGADQEAIDAANDRAKAAEQAAKNAKDVADAAVEAADARAKAAEKAAQKATEAAKEAAAKAAKDVADAKAAGDDAAVAAAEKAKEAAEKAVADAKEKQAAAERAADKAKAEAAKPFELPAFCSWAKPVCDALDWLQKPAPDMGEDSELDIDVPDITPVDTDINFGGSCPANFEFKGSIFGNPINIVLLDTAMFCDFLATYVKYPVYAASSLFALYILGGRKDA